MKISMNREEIVIEGVWEKPTIIPSQLFPFTGQLEVFYHGNTEECKDIQIKNIFESIPAMMRDCYANRDSLVEAFEDAEIQRERYKTYTGWMFIGKTLPIHHVFTVVDSKYLLDFYTDKMFCEHTTCGKISPIFMYVGSTDKPKVGRILLRKLAKEYHEQQEEVYE